jgi:hypothetical protein
MRRTLFLLLAAWPLALVLCLAACKREPDLPADPHVPLVNTFTGIWSAGGNTVASEYWQFMTDGTGGRAAAQAGPFPNNFSFFVYAGQDVQTAPSQGSLLILDDSGGADSVNVTLYEFSITGNQATLTVSGEPSITLERVSGSPQALRLTNPLIGEWSADWSGSVHGLTWSIKYRADGTVKTYHHSVSHQFENAYALRGNTLVIYGEWRFGIAPVIAEISSQGNGTWQVRETQPSPAPADWIYTKVAAAQWK